MTDLYALLGVSRGVSPEALKTAWRALARELHPDRNPDDPTASAKLSEVNAAYAVLSDPEKRRQYDRYGADAASAFFDPSRVEPSAPQPTRPRAVEAGADIVGVADTVGFAGPDQVGQMSKAMAALCGDRPFSVHLHDTRGLGLSNAAAALDNGCRVLDASLAGLGGCPFAPGATGNIVFEDLVFLSETKGFRTGIDIPALVGVRDILARELPNEVLYGALARSGPPPNVTWAA